MTTALVETGASNLTARELESKACTKCLIVQALSAFGPDRKSPTGTHSHCRACKRASAARRQAVNGDHVRALDRGNYQRHAEAMRERSRRNRRLRRVSLRAYFKRYRAERGRDVIAPAQRRWNVSNPEKRRAHSALWHAIKRGAVTRLTECQSCGAGGRIEAHHDDYSQPLIVRWLCGLCHEAADRARRATERAVA